MLKGVNCLVKPTVVRTPVQKIGAKPFNGVRFNSTSTASKAHLKYNESGFLYNKK